MEMAGLAADKTGVGMTLGVLFKRYIVAGIVICGLFINAVSASCAIESLKACRHQRDQAYGDAAWYKSAALALGCAAGVSLLYAAYSRYRASQMIETIRKQKILKDHLRKVIKGQSSFMPWVGKKRDLGGLLIPCTIKFSCIMSGYYRCQTESPEALSLAKEYEDRAAAISRLYE